MTGPKILVLDIETAPIIAHVWNIWNVNVGLNQIIKDWHLMSFAAKWLEEKKIFYHDQSKEKSVENDKKLLGHLHPLLDEADFVIAHHGKRFDIPRINTRLILQGFKPPSPYRIIDTKDIIRREFSFTSSKLEHVSRLLLKRKKLLHKKYPGHLLWIECLKGNQDAWREMKAYNIEDVLVDEELYLKVREWSSSHPKLSVYYDGAADFMCSTCGSTKVRKNGYKYTTIGKYQRYQCSRCGAYSRGSKLLNTKLKRDSILR